MAEWPAETTGSSSEDLGAFGEGCEKEAQGSEEVAVYEVEEEKASQDETLVSEKRTEEEGSIDGVAGDQRVRSGWE